MNIFDQQQWAGPPPMAAQPIGIQSTAGAVPVVNDKGGSDSFNCWCLDQW